MRSSFLPFHVPYIGDEEVDAVTKTLRSGWLTTGPQTQEFEVRFGQFIGAAQAIAVSSGTAALHLALEAAGVGQGDEVLVPTLTFAATAAVVCHLGARPVLIDCEADTLNLDPVAMEEAVSPRTRAVIPVHFAGHPCDMDRISEFARERNLVVIEDAAHALPARHRGKLIGTLSALTCFSFYATKTLTTGEGGMVTTSNAQWAERIRRMRLHGMSKEAWRRYSAQGSWSYEVVAPGYKYNMTDIAAAIGKVQLEKCNRMLEARTAIAKRYYQGFSDVSSVMLPTVRGGVEHAWHLFPIRLQLEALTIDRGQFIELLRERNIGTSVHFMPLHLHPYYRETWEYSPADFPRATDAYERLISLPIYPGMGDGDIDDVISAVREIARSHKR